MFANAICNMHVRMRTLSFMPPTASSPTPQHFTGLMQVSCCNIEFSCVNLRLVFTTGSSNFRNKKQLSTQSESTHSVKRCVWGLASVKFPVTGIATCGGDGSVSYTTITRLHLRQSL